MLKAENRHARGRIELSLPNLFRERQFDAPAFAV
jgi:hypothetical protein